LTNATKNSYDVSHCYFVNDAGQNKSPAELECSERKFEK
jgi:hypothetical protein